MAPENRKRRKPKRTEPDLSSWSPAEREAHLRKQQLDTPLAEMQVSVRIVNTLEEYGIIVAHQVMAQSYESLMKMKNFGERTLEELKAAVLALGLEPPKWEPPPKSSRGPIDSPFDLW